MGVTPKQTSNPLYINTKYGDRSFLTLIDVWDTTLLSAPVG